MVTDAKRPGYPVLREDLPSLGGNDYGLTEEEIRKRSDSAIQNIGALRLSIDRIERLTSLSVLMRDLLEDARVIVDAHGHKHLVRRIDKVLKDIPE